MKSFSIPGSCGQLLCRFISLPTFKFPTVNKYKYLLLAISALLCTPAWSATFYVSPGGSNSNAGTISSPWLTIQFGVDQLSPGDTLLVNDGDYRGFLVTNSGTSSAPITIKANGNAVNIVSDSGIGDDPEERITINDSDYIIIDGFKVPGDQTSGNGFGAHGATPSSPMHGLIIRNNTIHNVGSSSSPGNTCLYTSNAEGTIVENNILHDCGEHGVYIANAGAKNVIVRGNKIYNNGMEGIHNNGDLSSGGDGLITGLLISGNEIYQNSKSGISMDGVQDSSIINNLIYDNARHGISAYAIDGSGGPRNMKIINNTFNGNTNYAVRISEDEGLHVIFNNILLSDEGSIRTDSSTVAQTYKSDFNIVTGVFSTDSGSSTLSQQAWNQLTQQDANSTTSTASDLFVNTGVNDYSFTSDSSAINAGTDIFESIPAPASDMKGISRPQGDVFDIGAYELPVPQAPSSITVIKQNP